MDSFCRFVIECLCGIQPQNHGQAGRRAGGKERNMKFMPLVSTLDDETQLRAEYTAGRPVGSLRLGEKCLFFKKYTKIYYIQYTEVRRYFRRVMLVPAKLCCGRGDLEVENLVLWGEQGELAQIQLPGRHAAQVLMEELRTRMPDAVFGKPTK